MFESAEAAVAAAAEAMDLLSLGWHDEIDVGKLDQSFYLNCVFGQMHDGEYHLGLRELTEFLGIESAEEHFSWPNPNRNEAIGYAFASPSATEFWVAEIQARRAAVIA